MSAIFLPLAFLVVALVYSMVGLGGGTTYVALLVLLGESHEQLPSVALSLNLVVTSVGIIQFYRRGHISLQLVWPFLITSLPMAYLGGWLLLPRETFLWLLFISLAGIVVRIYLLRDISINLNLSSASRLTIMLLAGAVLGFIAGSVGIGGGILLVPVILVLGLARAQQAAGAGAVFVWVNSAAGLTSRFNRGAYDLDRLLPLAAAVLVGALIGSYLGAARLKPRTMQLVLGLVVIAALVSIGRQLR